MVKFHQIVETFYVNQNNKVIKINLMLITALICSSISHASLLPSGERSINPVCLNFPLAYEYRK
jgi:multisubunit Na+/H+ antiporter MnhE subunit